MSGRYELFDHTADVGVRVHAATLPELVPPAAQGLYTVIGELKPSGAPSPVRLEYAGSEPALLLRDYLAELLRRFETDQEIAVASNVKEFSAQRLAVVAQLAALDLDTSVLEREAKAVTYHQLEIRPAAGGYEATFIVDI